MATNSESSSPSTLFWTILGVVGVAAAMAVSELMAGLIAAIPSLIQGIGDWVIDSAPTPLKNWAIDTFGTADKPVLVGGIILTALLVGGVVGGLARGRSVTIGVAFGLFGVGAASATIVGSSSRLLPAVSNGLIAALVGAWVYSRLPALGVKSEEDGASGSRRRVLAGAGAVFGLSVLFGGVGRFLLGRSSAATASREAASAPSPPMTLPPPPPATMLEIEGITPLFVPNEDFYRIDTALSVPRVAVDDWTLSVTGMVNEELQLNFNDLTSLPLVERDVTLSCVSNQVGGGLVGNARWVGVPLEEVLSRAGVDDGAEQIVGHSVDEFTVGFPLAAARDGRTAIIAVEMNGEPLPFEHGFPARLVVAGLYGYVSATKWLSEIELTTWDGFDAYWVPRGWSKEGPVKTQSRIDVPRGSGIEAGPTSIAGVAWAPDVGIEMVEVQIDDDPWVEAELAESISDDSWRQWVYQWDATSGDHRIRVRATDGEGVVQTEERTPVAPDGASGWHTVSLSVS
ncbi:MAG: molybdopterin-dependent oxidoreductase [Acidimicrobiia bacterium]|nr:molybdopterin-dependent oxidoreductase [Acidimicrobiia bacterium]